MMLIEVYNLVRSGTGGKRAYSDVVKLITMKFPNMSKGQVQGAIWNSDVKLPGIIVKAERGVFAWTGKEIDPEFAVVSAAAVQPDKPARRRRVDVGSAGVAVVGSNGMETLTDGQLRERIAGAAGGSGVSAESNEILRRMADREPTNVVGE